MITPSPLESTKKELVLEINSFDKPKELSNVDAWSQLITNLIFLRPGTYPSMPSLGVGIEDYQYDFLEDTIAELSAAIIEQQRVYLQDIPLNGLNINKIEYNGQPTLLIQMSFNIDEDPGVANSAIAISLNPRHFLDFEVSWN